MRRGSVFIIPMFENEGVYIYGSDSIEILSK
jgi:hypothetical protein